MDHEEVKKIRTEFEISYVLNVFTHTKRFFRALTSQKLISISIVDSFLF